MIIGITKILKINYIKIPNDIKIIGIFIITFPFYFFSSGNPQISDFLLSLLFLSMVLNGNIIKLNKEKVSRLLIKFVLYTYIVTISWWIFIDGRIVNKLSTLVFPIFYTYNALLFMINIYMYKKYKHNIIKYIIVSIYISVFIQIILIPISITTGTRDSLFFNNPNQLGYYTLIMICLHSVLTEKIKSTIPITLLFYGAILLLAIISTSRAAIFSVLLIIFVNMIRSGIINYKQFISIALIVLTAVPIFGLTGIGKLKMDNVIYQFESIGQRNHDSLEGRGYDRIWENPQYLIFGAAEGNYDRFSEYGIEMHSSFGTIFFSYGIVGFSIFILFILNIFKKNGLIYIAYSIPIFAYGLTHMGLRFSIFWLYMSMVYITKKEMLAPPKIGHSKVEKNLYF